MSWIKDRAWRFVGSVIEGTPVELAVRATLLIFLLGPNLLGLEWHYKLLFQIVAVVGLVSPVIGRSGVFWCFVSVLMVVKTLDHWWMQDNHVFLLTWWCLALAIGLCVAESEAVIRTNARLLVGMSFLFAVVWKAFLSPDYMSGDYFHYTLLTDPRFEPLGTLLGGMPADDFKYNYRAVELLSDYTAEVESVQLRGTAAVRGLALVVTWWTIAIEGALALAFLVLLRKRFSRWRDALLLLFAWTTYLAAPVKTFGWTLIILGLAQCEREARLTRFCYVLTFPLLLIYEQAPIWSAIQKIAEWLGR